MKLLLDQNLSHRLVAMLAVEFPDSAHVRNLRLARASDSEIWSYASINGFTIASKDTDFEQRSFLRGHPPKVIWIRLGNCSTLAVADLLQLKAGELLTFEADSEASFLAIS